VLTFYRLSQTEKEFILSIAQEDFKKLGVQNVFINSISGIKSNGMYVFFVNTSKGIIVGTYKDHLLKWH